MTLLLAVQAITRNLRLTLPVLAALGAGVLVADVSGPMWTRFIFGAAGATVVLILLFRFGLLAYSAAAFVYLFLRRMPITLDRSDWYFGRSTFALAFLMAIALYGFFTSLGGKKWLPDLAIDG